MLQPISTGRCRGADEDEESFRMRLEAELFQALFRDNAAALHLNDDDDLPEDAAHGGALGYPDTPSLQLQHHQGNEEGEVEQVEEEDEASGGAASSGQSRRSRRARRSGPAASAGLSPAAVIAANAAASAVLPAVMARAAAAAAVTQQRQRGLDPGGSASSGSAAQGVKSSTATDNSHDITDRHRPSTSHQAAGPAAINTNNLRTPADGPAASAGQAAAATAPAEFEGEAGWNSTQEVHRDSVTDLLRSTRLGGGPC